jgi:hypothetical protein
MRRSISIAGGAEERTFWLDKKKINNLRRFLEAMEKKVYCF